MATYASEFSFLSSIMLSESLSESITSFSLLSLLSDVKISEAQLTSLEIFAILHLNPNTVKAQLLFNIVREVYTFSYRSNNNWSCE